MSRAGGEVAAPTEEGARIGYSYDMRARAPSAPEGDA